MLNIEYLKGQIDLFSFESRRSVKNRRITYDITSTLPISGGRRKDLLDQYLVNNKTLRFLNDAGSDLESVTVLMIEYNFDHYQVKLINDGKIVSFKTECTNSPTDDIITFITKELHLLLNDFIMEKELVFPKEPLHYKIEIKQLTN